MSLDPNDTIVALASARGAGARAVLRLSGHDAFRVARKYFESAETIDESRRRVYTGAIHLADLPPWPCGLSLWPAPRTYNGQPMAELHVQSAPPLVERLIGELLQAGARAAEPGEFTLRAFLAGKRDLPRAEAVHAVISATNRDQLTQALAQMAGGVSQPLAGLRDDLLNFLADVEAGLDFSDEDLSFVDQAEVLNRIANGLAQLTTLRRQLEQRAIGGAVFCVVLAGEPNAGKSSLFNALGGASALVSDEPGTTRDYLVKRLDLDGLSIDLVDTAGWQKVDEMIGRQAQSLGERETQAADLVLWCIEAGRSSEAAESTRVRGVDVMMVATKCDLASPGAGQVPTSAKMGTGLVELRSLIVKQAQVAAQPALAPSLSRCRHHVESCLEHMRKAHHLTLFEEPPELLALELRGALDQVGALVGAVYTDDLLDRIFSRFCIGK